MHPVIVGIDPGTTSAFAVLSFDFKVIGIKSKKDYSLAELISDIYKLGNPILVGTDKKEVPSFIKEFSQKTGAKIYSPKYDTKKGEKNFIVKIKGFSRAVKNAHETDALASAIYAYNEYFSVIKKIKSYVEKNDKKDIEDKILMKVITENKNIIEAVSDIEKKPVGKIKEVIKPSISKQKELSKEQKEIMLLKDVIRNLEAELNKVKNENIQLKQKKVDIGKETRKLISFKENRALVLEKGNKLLENEIIARDNIIKKLDLFISKSKNSILIKRLKNLGSEDYNKRKNVLNIEKDDILYVEDLSVISDNVIEDIKEKVKVIIYRKGTNKKLDELFLLIQIKPFDLFETKYFSLCGKKVFEKETEKVAAAKKKISIKDILEEYKKERLSDNIE